MSRTTPSSRLCTLLSEPTPVSLSLALALGLVGVGLYVGNLAAEGVGQPWFVAFLTAYLVGVGRLISSRSEG
jgi:hypothetical protein